MNKKILRTSGYSLAAEAIVAAFLYNRDGKPERAKAALDTVFSYPDMAELAQRLYDTNESAMIKAVATFEASDDSDSEEITEEDISEASSDEEEDAETDVDDNDDDEDETLASLEIARDILDEETAGDDHDFDDEEEIDVEDEDDAEVADFDEDDGDAEADVIDPANDDDDVDEMAELRGSKLIGKKSSDQRALSNLQAILNISKK